MQKQISVRRYLGSVVWLLISTAASAQLSPGELFKGHSHLEGNFNCTQCHTIGEKVSNEKCLNCHTEIKKRVDQHKGYHATPEVSSKSCFQCHSDHHGKNFQIIRFSEKDFNHGKTGYVLTGKHAAQDCKACHKSAFIEDPELRKKKFTYLGLSTACVGCHRDVHQGTLSDQCAQCHQTESFKPANLFEHQKTRFPLLGKHRAVDCKSCHTNRQVADVNKVIFEIKLFQQCNHCHDNPHVKSVHACQECHTEESFNKFAGQKKFNHQRTDFVLKGKHKSIACASCHQLQKSPIALFQDYAGRQNLACNDCHKDVHEGKFGLDCRQCHSEEGFTLNQNLERFDHRLTSFPLEGKHMGLDCKKCHKTNLKDPLPYQTCTSCHLDQHERVFKRPGVESDCRDCHAVDGFNSSSYGLEDHVFSKFPLEGAHLATPCASCHIKQQQWVFRNLGNQCIDCHVDPHIGLLSEKYYPEKNCQHCHLMDDWQSIQFDHGQTRFPLTGKHSAQACGECHAKKDNLVGKHQILFVNLPLECNGCHKDIHGGQFNENQGITHCENCHTSDDWNPTRFDHDKTKFKLEGKHLQIACITCHKTFIDPENKVRNYQLNKHQCNDCHQ